MEQRIVDLFDEFTHGGMDRRDFMARLARLAGGTAAAAALMPALENDYRQPGLVRPDDPRIRVEYVAFPGASGEVRAYLATPGGDGPFPAVVVIHENRGLNPHVEDVARRAAAAGFWAIAPDALSPLGGTPADTDQARSRMQQLDNEITIGDFLAGIVFADSHPASTGRVGCVGFCWGGGMANQLAVRSAELDAAVAFYGRQPDAAEVPRIRAALLLHYADLDTRINAGIASYREALDAAGARYELYMYDGVNHAFHNDTSPTRYDANAAALAWRRTVDFFNRYLRDA
ncbi:MAG TPA: dienelactone hydrolase family protein [Gemmatimonadales bacterium]